MHLNIPSFILIILSIIFLQTMTISCIRNNNDKSGNEMFVMTDAIVIQAKEANEIFRVIGVIQANEYVILKSEIVGKITEIGFEEGVNLKKGQILIKLDDSELQAQLKKINAQLTFAKSDEKRQGELLKINAISQEQYEQSKTNMLILEAEFELLKSKIEKTIIRAPFNGKAGLRKISLGDMVNINSELVTIADISSLKLEFSIPSKYSNNLKTSDKVEFFNRNQIHRAHIYASEPKADSRTGSLTFRARIENTKDLFPGLNVEMIVPVSEKEETISIPTQAIVPDVKGHNVFLIKNGKAETYPVLIGTRTDIEVEITEGLKNGDTLITSGMLHLKSGSKVKANINK